MAPLEIPGFEIIDKLGQGGMATVWKARQISLDRIVAIKILSNRLAEDDADIERFQQEAQSAAKLKHQGIVQVYDANASGGNYYFVMEYIAGYSVGDWIRRKKVLSEADAMLVAECVGDALDYAWNKEGIVHCDIKPDNIVIDADGTVKVADLGLARSISSTNEETDEIMGTPAYISPEQSLGVEDLDCRADMYSLGAMMYHMVTGQTLFMGQTETEVLQAQVQGQASDILEMNPDLSMGFCWLVEKLLMKDRDYRGDDWKEFQKDVELVKSGRMPSGGEFLAGYSTIDRSPDRTREETPLDDGAYDESLSRRQGISPAVFWGTLSSVAIVMILIVILLINNRKPPVMPPPVNPNAGNQSNNAASEAAKRKVAQAKDLYDYAARWEKENPDKYRSAIRKYQTVVENAKGTRYMMMAEDRITALERSRRQSINDAYKVIESRARALAKEGDYTIAINTVRNYNGPWANDISARRNELIAELERLKKKSESSESNPPSDASQQLGAQEAINAAAEFIAQGNLDAAINTVNKSLESSALGEGRGALMSLRELLERTQRKKMELIASYREDIGTVVAVDLVRPNSGRIQAKVTSVDPRKMIVYYDLQKPSGGSGAKKTFSYDDLSITERVMRMRKLGNQSEPAANLMMGLLAVQSRAYDRAKQYFRKVDVFGPMVIDAMNKLN